MHEDKRESAGVRVTKTQGGGALEMDDFWRFRVLNFGNLSSAYIACQGEARMLEMCQGEPNEENNPFAWVVVVENYPCSMRYDPLLPRVILLNKEGKLAARQACYVDDIHVAARGHEATVAACVQDELTR